MPMYTFTCERCGAQRDIIRSIAERDVSAGFCSNEYEVCADATFLDGSSFGGLCNGKLIREVVGSGGMIKPNGKYQPGAVFSNGDRVAGHFGKDAPRKRTR